MSAVVLAAVPVASAVVSAALLVFGLRRIVFAVAALWRPRPVLPTESIPSILVLLAARNEGPVVGRALRSLDQIRYPADNIEITLIDDGSTDETSTILAHWAQGRPRTRVTTVSRLAGTVSGKAAALTTGLAASPRTDLVAIVDADFELEPAGLALLAAAFSDPCIGAVSGYLRPRNADGGVVACYAALETWLHQLVTSAAKDRLGLDPPTIGLWVVRHDVLDAIGGFPDTVTGEDMRVAAAIARHGFRTRFLSGAVASNTVAASLAEYWWQHLRWARDVYAAELRPGERRSNLSATRLNESTVVMLARRGERMLSSAGYVDRLALTAAVALAAFGPLPVAIVLGYLVAALIEIGVAVRRGGSGLPWETTRVLAAAAPMFVVDVVATAVATVAATLRRDVTWRRQARRSV